MTDAAGRWRCDTLPQVVLGVWIGIEHPDYASDTRYRIFAESAMEPLRAGTAVMVMKSGVLVHGTVTDQAGRPVADAEVSQRHTGDRLFAPTTHTNARGEYTLHMAPLEGSALLDVEAKGYSTAAKASTATASESRVDFVLEPTEGVRAQVVDVEGKPVAGVGVEAKGVGARWSGTTDREGRFVWDTAPKEPVTCRLLSWPGWREHTCTLTASAEEYRIVMERAAVVRGSVHGQIDRSPHPHI